MNRDELGAIVMSLLGITTIIVMLAHSVYMVAQYADFAYSSSHGQRTERR